jgi:hypothetical protein
LTVRARVVLGLGVDSGVVLVLCLAGLWLIYTVRYGRSGARAILASPARRGLYLSLAEPQHQTP